MPLPPVQPPPTLDQLLKSFFPQSLGHGYTYQQPGTNESGIDVTQAGGTAVPLPFAGLYRPDLSTAYQQTFEIGGGVFESLVHTLPLAGLKAGQKVAAGQTAGYVYPGAMHHLAPGATLTGKPTGVYYNSTGPHFELDLLQGKPTDPAQFLDPKLTTDPVAYLARRVTPTGTTSDYQPAGNPNAPLPPIVGPGGLTDPSHYGDNLPKLPDVQGVVNGTLIWIGFGVAIVVLVVLLAVTSKSGQGAGKTAMMAAAA